ncbi:cytochrome b5-related protein-like isoform X1 [Zootermopsis nevadensis]|nr:cytochrome b5-related protein-like isoform X1 [Zootermopsis nevadensis]
MCCRNWRISHALSHHLYTNSLLDLELAIFEPLLQWVPHRNKSIFVRYVSWLYSFILYTVLFHSNIVIRLYLTLNGRLRPALRKEDLIPFFPLLVMYTYSGTTFVNAFVMWCWIVVVASFFFSLNGLNAAHHHPDIFHDGDAPRADRDWGICQIDAVKDRTEINSSKFLVLVTFGEHCLHHMFPTIDHWYLHRLYPVFYDTCKEFGITHRTGTVLDLLKGQFLQLARTEPNPNPPGK